MLGAALGREAEDGHAGLHACDVAGGLGCRHCDLCQLGSGGIGDDGAVGKDEQAVGAVGRILGEHHHERAGHDVDAGLGLDDLEGCAEHVAGGVEGTCHLSVGVAGLDHEAAQIEGIGCGGAGLLHRDAFLLAELEEEGSIFVDDLLVGGIDDGGLLDVFKLERRSHLVDFLGVADQDDVGDAVGDDAVCRCECAGFGAFGQHDALALFLGLRGKFFKKSHKSVLVL